MGRSCPGPARPRRPCSPTPAASTTTSPRPGRTGQWPALFSLAGVYPANWTPVDSLVIQGDLTQELDFTTTPLDYALLDRTLGTARTMAWFPILPPNQQHPYDPGPYRNLGPGPTRPR